MVILSRVQFGGVGEDESFMGRIVDLYTHCLFSHGLPYLLRRRRGEGSLAFAGSSF
jgi:hypothetical protein